MFTYNVQPVSLELRDDFKDLNNIEITKSRCNEEDVILKVFGAWYVFNTEELIEAIVDAKNDSFI